MYMVKKSTTTRFKNHWSKSIYYVDKGKTIIDTLFFLLSCKNIWYPNPYKRRPGEGHQEDIHLGSHVTLHYFLNITF